MRYYPIDENAARQARQMWTVSEYKAGSKTAEYRAQVDECYSIVDGLPDDLKERGAALADRYARQLAEWYNKQFRIELMCPSVMISGGSNFPVHKKEKQNAAQDRHYQLYDEIQAIPDKIKRLARGESIIKAGDGDALEKLHKKLAEAEELQAKMKAANAYYRKHKTLKGFDSFTDALAEQLDKAIESGLYNVPFPPYELTNNNAKIRATKARIAQIERIKSEAEAAQSVEDQAESKYSGLPFEVVENAEIMRLQLIFEDKPDAETRAILKKHGFKWAPSNSAWQRQLTQNAKYALERIIEEIAE